MQKFNEEIEQALLGTLIVNDKIYDLIAPNFNSNWFYNPVHSRIYDVISEMYEDGRTPAVPLLVKYFENDEDLEQIGGGAKYIQDLTGCFVSVQAAPQYAEEIFNHHTSRMIESMAREMVSISNDTENADKKISQIEEIAFNMRSEKSGEIKSSETSVNEALKTIEYAQKGFNGVESGLRSLDNFIKGFRPSSLYVLAARPAMGKSALAITIAGNVAENNKHALVFSLEMEASQLQQRYIARVTGISVDDQMERLPEEKINQVITAVAEIGKRPLWIDDQPAQKVNSMLSKARRHIRLHGVDIIFIDYLGLVGADDLKIKKVYQIEQITTGLKRMAKILKIPIVLLCQLNRGLESRENKRPMLSDLRDSGAIEQDADVVMFIYRDEMYSKEPPAKTKGGDKEYGKKLTAWQDRQDDNAGRAEIIIGKNRQGKTGTAHVMFDGIRQEFYNVD